MKFICTQDNLERGLARVAPLAGRNLQLAALTQVLCRAKEGAMELVGTDLEVGVQTVVPGKVEEEGSCTVTARTLFDYVQQLPGSNPVVFSVKGTSATVKTEGFQASFPTGEVDDFPLLPEVAREGAVKVAGKNFCKAVADVAYAAAKDMTRPEIHSVLVAGKGKELWVAATDSFRLSEEILAREGEEADFSLLLPLAAAQEIVRLFSQQEKVMIFPQESHVTLQGEGLEMTSRLMEGRYPDYRQIIPKKHLLEGVVDRAAMSQALKTLSVFLPRDSRRMKCVFSPDKGKLSMSVGGERGEGEVEVELEGKGEEQEVFFNIQYLLEGMQHLPGDSVKMQVGGGQDPAVFSPGEGARKTLYVVMPIQA